MAPQSFGSESIAATRAALVSGELNPAALLAQCRNLAQANSGLNAFISFMDEDNLRNSADSVDISRPLAGIPFSIKDNILSSGFPVTAGTRMLESFIPERDAGIVRRLKDSGAILVGKNNLSEFCQSITCENAVYGSVCNPVNPNWIAGGSSGGSAAAVAAGIVPFSVGTDTGGSVRIPAALCGCWGFRPSTGRYPVDGLVPVSPSIDTPGIIARSAEDVRYVDAVISGETVSGGKRQLQAVRVGVPDAFFFDDLDAGVRKRCEHAMKKMALARVDLIPVNLRQAVNLNANVGFPIASYEMLRELSMFLAREGLPIGIKQLIDAVEGRTERNALYAQISEMAVTRADYVRAIQTNWPHLVRLIDEVFVQHSLDLIVVPTTPLPAINLGQAGETGTVRHNGRECPVFQTYIRNVEIFSNYGGPGVSMPVGCTDDGKPVGLEMTGRRGLDNDLLAISATMEKELNFVIE